MVFQRLPDCQFLRLSISVFHSAMKLINEIVGSGSTAGTQGDMRLKYTSQ